MQHMPATGPNAYLKTKVMTASPAELRLMLLDGAIKFAEQTKAGLERKDHEAVFTSTTRCQDILLELINGLRPEHNPELCGRLAGLYTFLFSRMVAASSQRNPATVDEVLRLLRYERDTWNMLLEQLARENAQAGTLDEAPDSSAVPAPPLNGSERGGVKDSLIGGRVSVRG